MPSSNEVRLYSQGGYVGMSQIVPRVACPFLSRINGIPYLEYCCLPYQQLKYCRYLAGETELP